MQFNDTTTFIGIKQDLYFTGKFNASTFDTRDVDRIVNKYYGQIQEIIRAVNENFYMIVARTDLYIGDGTYTFPDGVGVGAAPAYEKIKSLFAAFSPQDITNPLPDEFQRVDFVDPNQISNPSYSFTSPKALIYGDYFVLLPLVTDITKYPVTLGVKILYIQQLDYLVLDTDTPKIFRSFHDAITWGSLIDIADRLGNDRLLKKATEMYEKRCKEIAAYASNRILDLQEGLVEGQDTAGGWAYPWGQDSMS